MNEFEIWKPVVGFEEQYEVSNFGKVRSVDRIQRRSNGYVECDFRISGKVLKPYITGRGYPTVALGGKNVKVHRIVAEAFLKRDNYGKDEVNHIDGNKNNNRADNLEWVTGSENTFHALKAGLKKTGESAFGAKLTAKDVEEIRKTYVKGSTEFGAKPLSKKYGVSDMSIRQIVRNRKWRFAHD